MPARSYTDRTLNLLWWQAGGRWGFPECRIELLADSTARDSIVVIGEIAHMAAAQERGPRADAMLSPTSWNDYAAFLQPRASGTEGSSGMISARNEGGHVGR